MCLTLGFLSTLLNPGSRVRHDPLHPVRCVDGSSILDKSQSPQHILRRDDTNNHISRHRYHVPLQPIEHLLWVSFSPIALRNLEPFPRHRGK
ncbi:hypothetical protein [Prosthecochloris sp. ZM]|uniref:hypothetical protein n=1 Tax=Prosthecochloris sp. ZM TaxID=2283143 RepID=UPI0011C05843|nr:hypothetical protein [Prosthecochloris sp. ZM]